MNHGTRGLPPPIPYHSKPVTVFTSQLVHLDSEREHNIQDLKTDSSLSTGLTTTDSSQVSTTVLATSERSSVYESDEEYWRHVPDFDVESVSTFLTTLEISNEGSDSGMTPSSGTSVPSGFSPTGPSGSFHADTSGSVPAHPLTPRRKKGRYYCITRGRAIGVFDDWTLVKSYTTGVDGIFNSYTTKEEAWKAFDLSRELGQLELM
ncbi:hypothetical protein F5887DRAFT_1074142 [Amanita rubescens]|nr:hypothetical protein F5887DRAFT_1074142 [Amanita rubescens]